MNERLLITALLLYDGHGTHETPQYLTVIINDEDDLCFRTTADPDQYVELNILESMRMLAEGVILTSNSDYQTPIYTRKSEIIIRGKAFKDGKMDDVNEVDLTYSGPLSRVSIHITNNDIKDRTISDIITLSVNNLLDVHTAVKREYDKNELREITHYSIF